MVTKFSFSAFGILAVACFAMLLYVTTSLSGRVDVGAPLLTIAGTIVVAFILYMFVKLVMSRRY